MTDEQVSSIEQRIGARILIARTRREMSAQSVAIMAGVGRNTVYRIEAGDTNCSLRMICKIAHALEIQLADLFA